MKDWCVLLSNLTDEQESHLCELCVELDNNYAGLMNDEDCIRSINDRIIDYSWASSKCEKITYEEAVKRLNKLIKERKNEKSRK